MNAWKVISWESSDREGCFLAGLPTTKMLFWKGIKSDVNDPLLITMQSSPPVAAGLLRTATSIPLCYSLFAFYSTCLIIQAEVYIHSVFPGNWDTTRTTHCRYVGSAAAAHASLTAFSLADHSEVHLFFAGPHVQLALAVVSGAVAAAHRLVGLHALGSAHTLTALGITDRPKWAFATGLI